MRTWGDLKNEVLGLIFANNSGGIKVSTSADEVQEYIINMSDAANSALRELATVCPLRKSVVITTTCDVRDFDMSKLCEDFMTFEDDGVYYKGGEVPEKANNYFIRSGSIITFSGEKCGVYEVGYMAYPEVITTDTSEEYELDIADNLLDAAVYYIASRLCAEDDLPLATYYMNIYESKKAVLEKFYITSAGTMGGRFVSERGWY